MAVRTVLSRDERSAARARRFVEEQLVAAGLDDLGGVATLLVSELVTNAVVHAVPRAASARAADIAVTVRFGPDRLRVEVCDGDPKLPRRRRRRLLAPGGRGLLLVEELAMRWGAEHTSSGKSVWFELTVPAVVPAGRPRARVP